ncbi:MAG: serine/threonine-protein kinase [Planctomycetaceae bacterium]|nr:serine/threonine-protein kinase [Planctomycetaceae bacterium]
MATEREIFVETIQAEDVARRRIALDEACGPDVALRRRMEALLRVYDNLGGFLQEPVAGSAAAFDHQSACRLGALIGPYKLVQQIGEGGMGTVFLAEQTHPVQRQVALKVIRPGFDSRSVTSHFEAERQTLALMDHPNIAKVLDAGTTESGQSYFVMELVQGVPITTYCDERRLSPRQRLELLAPVCLAVHHAHQKGIIHRDLKPSNVLIAQYDGRPVPKVIDFGVAKATGSNLAGPTSFTEFGSIIGTLEYMSPEQAGSNQVDIDTRSDIFSLGVLLYELLTGTTPLNKQRTRDLPLLDALRVIKEEEPPKPSTRLGADASTSVIAARRDMEPARLVKLCVESWTGS